MLQVGGLTTPPRGGAVTDAQADAWLAAYPWLLRAHDLECDLRRSPEPPLVKTPHVSDPTCNAAWSAFSVSLAIDAYRPVFDYLRRWDDRALAVVRYRLWRQPLLPWREVAAKIGLGSHTAAMEAMDRARQVFRERFEWDKAWRVRWQMEKVS